MITRTHPVTLPKIHTNINRTTLGVMLSVLSSVLFGVLYAYAKWLEPLTGTQVFLWRMVMMWVCLALFLVVTGRIIQVKNELTAIRGIKSWLILLLPTPIFASQLWLFMWAPVNGQSVEVAMGYFLLPLVLVLVGCGLFSERLSRLQTLAVVLAGAGVAMEIMRTGGISVATVWVCGTYPIYYVMRRHLGVRAVTGIFLDMSIIAPVALVAILWGNYQVVTHSGVLFAKVIGLGVISVLAFVLNLESNRLLSVSLFGMLSYVEPVLLFVLSVVVLGGAVDMTMVMGYGLIWLAVVCLIAQGVILHYRKQPPSTT